MYEQLIEPWIEWASTNSGIASAVALLIAVAGGVWRFCKWLSRTNPYPRLTRLEGSFDVQKGIQDVKSEVERLRAEYDAHKSDCLRTRCNNQDHLTRLEDEVDRQGDKLNRIEGFIEGSAGVTMAMPEYPRDSALDDARLR